MHRTLEHEDWVHHPERKKNPKDISDIQREYARALLDFTIAGYQERQLHGQLVDQTHGKKIDRQLLDEQRKLWKEIYESAVEQQGNLRIEAANSYRGHSHAVLDGAETYMVSEMTNLLKDETKRKIVEELAKDNSDIRYWFVKAEAQKKEKTGKPDEEMVLT